MAPYRAPGPSATPAKSLMSLASACPCLGPAARLVRIRTGGSFGRRRPLGRVLAIGPSYYVARSYAKRSSRWSWSAELRGHVFRRRWWGGFHEEVPDLGPGDQPVCCSV